MDRCNLVLGIRPEIPSARVTQNMSEGEQFQNGTLRPIIKFQNPLFVVMFRNYIVKYKNAFHQLPTQKRFEYIENAVQKDMKFRNSLKGTVIGQFTLEEYETYIKNSSALNKRMMNMVVERLKDQIQLFEEVSLV
ncbi:glyoxalase [Pricia sp.]|uniref:glyoxalase n=1 Tax=Pricia sp. TaxID=2268138 RepID=UPI003594842F